MLLDNYLPTLATTSSSSLAITFCQHCETISSTFKIFNQKIDKLENDNLQLKSQIDTLLLKKKLSLQDVDITKFYFNTKIRTLALPSDMQQKIRQYTVDIASQKQQYILTFLSNLAIHHRLIPRLSFV